MRKFKIFTATALLALSSLLSPGLGYSASQLPQISTTAGSVQQFFCPTGSQFGCFGPTVQTNVNGSVNAAPYAYTPFEPCLQFMQFFMRLAAGPR